MNPFFVLIIYQFFKSPNLLMSNEVFNEIKKIITQLNAEYIRRP